MSQIADNHNVNGKDTSAAVPGLCVTLFGLHASAHDLPPIVSAAAKSYETRVKPLKTRYLRVFFSDVQRSRERRQIHKLQTSDVTFGHGEPPGEAPKSRRQYNGHAANCLFPPFTGFYRLSGGGAMGNRALPSQAICPSAWYALARLRTLRYRPAQTDARKSRAAWASIWPLFEPGRIAYAQS
jgi:hypothetical protein